MPSPVADAISEIASRSSGQLLQPTGESFEEARRVHNGLMDRRPALIARCATPMGQLLLEHFHGTATRVAVGDTAFTRRADGYNLVVISEWMESANADRCVAWARPAHTAMEPFFASGRYGSYLGDDETGDPIAPRTGPSAGASRRSKRSTIRAISST
jgi:hypothetical protein